MILTPLESSGKDLWKVGQIQDQRLGEQPCAEQIDVGGRPLELSSICKIWPVAIPDLFGTPCTNTCGVTRKLQIEGEPLVQSLNLVQRKLT